MTTSTENISTERRDLLRSAAAISVGALAVATVPGSFIANAHEIAMPAMHGVRRNKAMTDALSDCVKASEDCIVHCIELIEKGDSTLFGCLRSAQEAMNFCKAHGYLAASDSPFLNAMSELSIKICGNCQRECEKQKKHALCKACGDACAECVKVCKQHLKI